MLDGGSAVKDVSAEHLRLGAVLLELVADWDVWVSRRVDRFSFIGDDERQLQRHQSLDFKVPGELTLPELPLIKELGGFPIPITFVQKWRLPQFSLREAGNGSVSLLQREESSRLATAMLVVLAEVAIGSDRLAKEATQLLQSFPERLWSELLEIPAADRTESLRRCAELTHRWSDGADAYGGLRTSEPFMSLLYEFACGSLVMACVDPARLGSRYVLKFSYNSYIGAGGKDSARVKARHALRWLQNGSRDAIDPSEWTRASSRRKRDKPAPSPRQTGRLIFTTICESASEELNHHTASLAAALVTIRGPHPRPSGTPEGRRRRQTVRVRPSGVVIIDGFPPGEYTLEVESRSGYDFSPEPRSFTIAAGELARVHLRTRQVEIGQRVTKASPTLGASQSNAIAISRGVGWRSKPLAIRVRSGGGGSYHCEFEAPPGLHVTRARLLSNLDGNVGGSGDGLGDRAAERLHDVDTVLKSAQRAHLYGPARPAADNRWRGPSTGYALVNLRPRIETIIRPAWITALAVVLAVLFLTVGLARGWFAQLGQDHAEPHGISALLGVIFGGGEKSHTETPWALVALLLAGPGVLAAYVAQAVASRVTNAMLWGLRLLAMVPTILSLIAIGVLLLDGDSSASLVPLWVLCGATAATFVVLCVTYFLAEHTFEQRPDNRHQGPGFEERYAAAPFRTYAPPPVLPPAPAYRPPADDDPGAAIRDRMLERIGGITHSTRGVALRERSLLGRSEREVSPALYFDSAEAPAVFLGLGDGELAKLRKGIRDVSQNPPDA